MDNKNPDSKTGITAPPNVPEAPDNTNQDRQDNQEKPDVTSQKTVHKDKIQTLLGFAVRAGKLIYGADTVTAYTKKLYLIIVCPTLSEKSLKGLLQTAQARNIPVLKTRVPLEKILFKTNCKTAALRDKQMAVAITLNINEANSNQHENYTFL